MIATYLYVVIISFDEIGATAQQMMAKGIPKQSILNYLAGEAEKIVGCDSACSILLLDESGVLRNGASPRLPADYLKAIDGIRPDPNVGTCAAAAATGLPVMTPDFRADDKWAELKHLPMSIGYTGAWSMPIKNHNGRVLGTFGTYYRQPCIPSGEEQTGIALLARVAAQVLAA
jgi:GAF domain-containing protein